MPLLSANGIDGAEARVVLPRIGAWHLDATLNASDGIAEGDVVTVTIGAETILRPLVLVGTATRAQAFEDALRVRVVAGAGGLGSTAAAKFYQGAQLRLVLADLLAAAGETQSSTIDAGLLGILLSNWSTFARSVGVELATLLSVAPAETAWRMLADGTLWIGAETWPDAALVYETHDRDPRRDRITLGVESPTLLPGSTLDGERIGDVEHLVTAEHVTTIARLA